MQKGTSIGVYIYSCNGPLCHILTMAQGTDSGVYIYSCISPHSHMLNIEKGTDTWVLYNWWVVLSLYMYSCNGLLCNILTIGMGTDSGVYIYSCNSPLCHILTIQKGTDTWVYYKWQIALSLFIDIELVYFDIVWVWKKKISLSMIKRETNNHITVYLYFMERYTGKSRIHELNNNVYNIKFQL